MKKYIFLLVVLFALLYTNGNAQEKLIDRVVATVGSNIILQSDVEFEYTQYLASGGPQDPNFKCRVMQQLVMTKLLAQQAVIDSVEVSEAEVDDRLNANMRQMIQQAQGKERLEGFLKRSILQYKEEIRPVLAEQMRANKLQQNIIQKITVTPQEVKKYFDNLKANQDTLPYFNTEVEIGELVVVPELTKEEKEQFRQKAEGYRQQVLSGSDFGTIARFYSDCPSAPAGGDLGFATRDNYVKEFSAVAFKLKPGDISEVFETQHGFHFLQVLDRRGDEVNVRHVLINTKPTPESLARAKVKIDSIYKVVTTGKMNFHTAASLYSENLETKFNGGMVFDQESQTRTTVLSMEKLERDIFMAIDTLKAGQMSKPYQYTKVDQYHPKGAPAYRFNFLKTRIPPHQANLDQDFAKIQGAAHQDKISRYLSEWFEKQTQSTYIHINDDFAECEEVKELMKKDDKLTASNDSTKD